MGQGVNTTSIDTLLDNIFADVKMEDLVPNEASPAWEDIEKAPAENMNQKGGFYMVQVGATNSAQDSQFIDSEETDYPMPSESKYLRLVVPPIVTRATVQVTEHAEMQNKGKYMEMPAKNLDTVVRDVDGEMRFVALKRSRQLWGNRSNEVARVSAINYATRTITCNNAGNLFGVRNLEMNLRLEVRDSSNVLRQDAALPPWFKVEGTNRTLLQFTYSAKTPAPSGIGNGDILYGYGDYNNGWNGIDYLTQATGSFEGVSDRSTNDRLRGIRIDAAQATLHASLLRRMISAQRNRIDQNKKRSGMKFYASAQIDQYEASGFAQQGYADSGPSMKRGYRDLYFADIPFEYDRFVPADSIFLGTLKKVHKFEMQNFQPIKDGATYLRRLPGQGGQSWSPKKQIIFQGIGNLGTNDPTGLGVWLTNLNTSDVAIGND